MGHNFGFSHDEGKNDEILRNPSLNLKLDKVKRNSESKLTNEFITKLLFAGSSSLSLICNELFSQEAASV